MPDEEWPLRAQALDLPTPLLQSAMPYCRRCGAIRAASAVATRGCCRPRRISEPVHVKLGLSQTAKRHCVILQGAI